MRKGTQLNLWIHEQMNMGTVKKFKAVHILASRRMVKLRKRILPLLV